MVIKFGSKKSIPAMKALWKDTFNDTDLFIDLFFEKFYRPRKTLLLFEEGELISMLFFMDVFAKYGRKRLKCAYLYGVATKLNERRRGHFSRLHSRLVEILTERRYDAVLTLPENDRLFDFYKSFGYIHSLKTFEYRLMTPDISEVSDPSLVWHLKRENFKASGTGLQVLETEEQFMESRRDHKFFAYGESYLAFAPNKDGYLLYEVISPAGENVPVELIHYERRASLLDLSGRIDAEAVEKQKPAFSYLLN